MAQQDRVRTVEARVTACSGITFSRRWPTLKDFVSPQPPDSHARSCCSSCTFGVAFGAWRRVRRLGAHLPRRPVSAGRVARRLHAAADSKLYAADGRFIAELGLERRTLVKLDEIPLHVQQAFVITEDKRFYSMLESTGAASSAPSLATFSREL